MNNNNSVGVILGLDTSQALKNAKDLQRTVKSLGNDIKEAFQVSNIITWGLAIKNVTEQMISASKAESDFIENTNLLKVAYHEGAEGADELIKKSDDLINTLKNFYGLDPNNLTKQLGIYKQMTNAMGMTNEASATLSENMLKMQEDVSSLYNMDFSRVGSKFQSALAGQTRAVRDLGVDITKTALQQELYNRGINEDIDNMNRASKTVLIYLTMERQLAEANGDAARTINGVANQTRIFKEQLGIAARQLGAVFIPVLKAVLPILNGILMALNAIGEFILGLLGINVKDLASEFGIANVNTGLGDIGDNAIKAGKAVDDLTGKLRGFDKLNVITTPKQSGADYGLGLGGGVDNRLLGSMKDYNKELEEVKNKAKEIRDAILQWLGFTIDENGEINGFSITLGTIVGALAVGGVLYKGALGIYNIFKGLGNILGIGGSVGKGINGISSALKGTGGVSKEANAFKVPKITTILKGLADIALIVAGLGVIVVAIGGLMQIPGAKWLMGEGLNTVKDLFTSLGSVAIQIGFFSAVVVGLGLVSPAIVLEGMLGLVAIIGGLEILILALGALMQIPILKEIHSQGKEVLFDIADTIGGFAGKIVSGFADKATEGIGMIGQHLADFMNNAKPFFEGLKNIDEGTASSAKALADAVLEITAASFLNSISNFFSFITGENSLEKFGDELLKFAPKLVAYSNIIDDVKSDVVEKSATAAKALAEFYNQLPSKRGLVQAIFGEKSLSEFSEELVPFGKSLAEYYISIKDIKPDVVEKSANAAKALAEMAKAIPDKHGLVQAIFGEKDLKQFGEELVPFGKSMKEYYESIRYTEADVVEKSANAGKALAQMSQELNNSGGALAWLFGEKNLAKFGEQLEQFGWKYRSYYNTLTETSADTIDRATNSIRQIVEIAERIKNNDLGNTMKDFGNSLDKSSTGLTKFFNQSNANDLGYNFGKNIAEAIARGLKNFNFPKLEVRDGWNTIGSYQIKAKAEGGFLDSGDVFVARENGLPEMVGTINGKTAVANNDQIVDAIAIGVAKAMSSNKSNANVNIIAQGDDNGFMNYITFKQQQRDRQYGF